MNRSGYSDGIDNWAMIKWRGMVASASRGKRGQKFFKELIEALDAMPIKRLVANDLERDGEVCALGCLAKNKGLEIKSIDTYDHSALSGMFDIAECLAQETMYENDEGAWRETEEDRWKRIRAWAVSQLKATPPKEKDGEA